VLVGRPEGLSRLLIALAVALAWLTPMGAAGDRGASQGMARGGGPTWESERHKPSTEVAGQARGYTALLPASILTRRVGEYAPYLYTHLTGRIQWMCPYGLSP
jgi:hypothetical protein